MKYLQLVMGSAGVGKSTYCRAVQDAGRAGGRTVRVVSLDPAAEAFRYEACADVRELVSVDDVMAELGLGPNGALLWALEHVLEERAWLEGVLDDALEDDTVLLDCPGCVELYSHVPLLPRLAAAAAARGYAVAAVYLVDAHFVTDAAKLIAGSLAALAAMAHFELPHVNVLSKCDLIDSAALERYLQPAGGALVAELNRSMGSRFRRLNAALARILDEYDMVGFVPLDVTDEESVAAVMAQVDNAVQYGEDMEPREPREWDGGGGGGGGGGGDGDDEGDEADDVLREFAEATRGGAGGGGGGGDDGFYGAEAARRG